MVFGPSFDHDLWRVVLDPAPRWLAAATPYYSTHSAVRECRVGPRMTSLFFSFLFCFVTIMSCLAFPFCFPGFLVCLNPGSSTYLCVLC